MIKKIDKRELLGSFFDLAAEVEFGNHFDKNKPEYTATLHAVVDKHLAVGAEIFGCYTDDSGEPEGFITFVVHRRIRAKSECEVLEIGVMKKFRRQGIGSELLRFVEKQQNKEAVYCILIKTYAGDSGAIHFYGRNGYPPISVIPDTQGPGDEGTIVMRKWIK